MTIYCTITIGIAYKIIVGNPKRMNNLGIRNARGYHQKHILETKLENSIGSSGSRNAPMRVVINIEMKPEVHSKWRILFTG
jgi:hypothetical protein